jgi:hypothetical protein
MHCGKIARLTRTGEEISPKASHPAGHTATGRPLKWLGMDKPPWSRHLPVIRWKEQAIDGVSVSL